MGSPPAEGAQNDTGEPNVLAVVEALNASVDLLLVAFDGSQFYRLFACASDAFEYGSLDTGMLLDSEVRLKRSFAAD